MGGDKEGDGDEGWQAKLAFGLFMGWLFAAALALPAIYMLLAAIYEAVTTGSVLVNPASRGAPRAWVHWSQAWAHILGLALIIACGLRLLLPWPTRKLRDAATALCLIGAPLGLVLWFYSGILIKFSGVLFVVGFITFVALMSWIDKRLGRTVTTMMLLGFVGVALFI